MRGIIIAIVLIIVLLLVGGGAFLFLRNRDIEVKDENEPTPTETLTPLPTATPTPTTTGTGTPSDPLLNLDTYKTYISKFGGWKVPFPQDWNFYITTPATGNGKFGKIVESWIIQSFASRTAGSGGIPSNSVKMDFSIEENDTAGTLDDVIPCSTKSTQCTDVEINGQRYKKDEQRLNDAMNIISVGTIKDDRVYLMNAYIQTGTEQDDNVKIVQNIINNFKF